MNRKNVFWAILSATTLLIAACSGLDPETEQARSSAIDVVSGIVGGSVSTVRGVTGYSNALEILTAAVEKNSATAAAKVNIATRGVYAFATRTETNKSSLKTDTTDEDNGLDELNEDELKALLDELLSNPQKDGDLIIYTPNIDNICNTDAECRDFFQHITIIQKIHSADSGTLTFMYDDYAPLVIGYAPGLVYFETAFNDLKHTLLGIDPNLELPQTAEGSVRLTIDRIGIDAYSIKLGIQESVVLAGNAGGENYNFTMAATSRVVEIRGDAIEETASVEFDINSTKLEVPHKDAMGQNHQAIIELPEFTGIIKIDNKLGVVTVERLGIGNDAEQPFSMHIDEQTAFAIFFNTLDVTVDGVAETITIESVLNLDLQVANIYDIFKDSPNASDPDFAGTLSLTTPGGTVFTPVQISETGDEGLKLIELGPLNVTGTGSYLGDLSVLSGECFKETAETEPFPFLKIQCP